MSQNLVGPRPAEQFFQGPQEFPYRLHNISLTYEPAEREAARYRAEVTPPGKPAVRLAGHWHLEASARREAMSAIDLAVDEGRAFVSAADEDAENPERWDGLS